MSNNLQEVFQKFGFRKSRNRDRNSKTRRHSDSEDDDDHKQEPVVSQKKSSRHQQTVSSPNLSQSQREYIENLRREKQEKANRAKQRRLNNQHHSTQSATNINHNKSSKTHRDKMAYQPSTQQQYRSSHNTQNGATSTSRHHHHPSTQQQIGTHSNRNHHHSSSSKQQSSSSRKRGHHPNGAYAHLDPKLFHQNITTQQIQKIMGLRSPPLYRTDEKGYIEFQPGLCVRNNFVILDTLGRGTFSKVFEAVDINDSSKCAIKVIRNTHRYIEAAKTELRVLQHITNADDGTSACIHLADHFSWQNHPCFVFKLYGPSIYTVMSRNRFRAFPDCISRSLTYQICNAIQFLHHLGIIFTDLKPENMVFVDGRTYPVKIHNKTHLIPIDTRIKIVDFGSAVYEPRYDPNNPKTWKFKDGYNYLIQTRHYRAPEVVLEMPWKRPVDVWSVGCVILEFLYGSMVFNTHCPIDHLNQMQKMIGQLPRDLIRASSDAKYKQLFHHPDGSLRLEDARRSRAQAKRLDSYFNLHKLEHRHLYDLVSRCLKWRANERILGAQLLKHEYFHFIKNILTHQHKFALYSSNDQQSSKPKPSSSSTSHQGQSGNNNPSKNANNGNQSNYRPSSYQ